MSNTDKLQQKPLGNDRLLRALRREPLDRFPVWIMRQAGRYLPEYRALRAKAGSFMRLCQTPEWACEVTLQPLKRFPLLDAAIIFSDILTIPDAMGLGLKFIEGLGPRFARPIRTPAEMKSLTVPDMAQLNYVMEAITLTQQALDRRLPLIGFSGSPWTLACYMVEGGSSRHFHAIKKCLYTDPLALHHLLDVLATSVTHYLNAQIQAGADVIMLFDTWGGILSTPAYHSFSLAYLRKIAENIQREREGQSIPLIIFTKGGGAWLEFMADIPCEGLGLDWQTDLTHAYQRVGHKKALQGNLDPAVLFAAPTDIRQAVKTLLTNYPGDTGLVCNLGHGITPDINPDHVAVFLKAVHDFKIIKQT